MGAPKAILLVIFVMILLAQSIFAQGVASSIPADTAITLEWSRCYGACPVYKVTIGADGSVTFDGKYFVKVQGTAKKVIDQKKVIALVSAFEAAKYFTLNDRYKAESDGCPMEWTDNPTAVTSITIGGKSKSVSHYHGCKDANGKVFPAALTELERKIDEIVGTAEWIGTYEERRNNKPPFPRVQ